MNAAETTLTVLLMACAYIYFGLYFYHLFQAMIKLKDLPRQDNKMASLQIRLQVSLAHRSAHRNCNVPAHGVWKTR